MFSAGLDIGSSTCKAVIVENGWIKGWMMDRTGPDPTESALRLLNRLLGDLGLDRNCVSYIVATGYGRLNIPFASAVISELSCHAYGSYWVFPEVRTILDMGGQDCKVMRCNEKGKLINFVMNDKCAAGTGRYLERVAGALGLKMDEVGPLSLEPIKGALPVSTACAVFAESDVLRLQRQGNHINDILAGAHEAIITRICGLLDKISVERELCICGGIAKNIGVVKRLEQRLGFKALTTEEPQIVGALGAALFAGRRAVASDSAQRADKLENFIT